MTRDEILNMEAGREMDALIEKNIVRNFYVFNNEYPSYSTDLIAAWVIIPALEFHPDEILFKLVRKGSDRNSLKWGAEFRKCRDNQQYYYAQADTAPLAICRAALLAVMEVK